MLGAAVYGPKAGALLGGVFGAVVAMNCITGADGGGAMVFQASPLLCILVVLGKGVLAGWVSALVYRWGRSRNGYVAMMLASVACPVINTGTFLVCMMSLFKDVLAAWASGGEIIAYVLSGLVLCNFVPELVINVLFSPFGQRIVHTIEKKM